jgi:hypothetical protein
MRRFRYDNSLSDRTGKDLRGAGWDVDDDGTIIFVGPGGVRNPFLNDIISSAGITVAVLEHWVANEPEFNELATDPTESMFASWEEDLLQNTRRFRFPSTSLIADEFGSGNGYDVDETGAVWLVFRNQRLTLSRETVENIEAQVLLGGIVEV